MWDFSRGPGLSSKWRRVTPGQRARQEATARRLDRLVRGERVRACGEDGPTPALQAPAKFKPEDEAVLRALLDAPEHARALRAHLARCVTEAEELRLAWAYRATLQDTPGAWPAWIAVCRTLGGGEGDQ